MPLFTVAYHSVLGISLPRYQELRFCGSSPFRPWDDSMMCQLLCASCFLLLSLGLPCSSAPVDTLSSTIGVLMSLCIYALTTVQQLALYD